MIKWCSVGFDIERIQVGKWAIEVYQKPETKLVSISLYIPDCAQALVRHAVHDGDLAAVKAGAVEWAAKVLEAEAKKLREMEP